MTVTHTFLMQPGRWRARGRYFDEDGREFPASGFAHVAHDDTVGRNRSGMSVAFADEPLEIRSDYSIEPWRDGAPSTRWHSENPALGRLDGTFVLAGDTILSLYRSEDGQYTGAESVRRLADDRYDGRGTLLRHGEPVGSWMLVIEPEP